jgi:ATP-dependent Clp protease ATP-binding subunit ClpC
LIGSAPGYIGYEEGGQLTEKVRRKPYSIVLLDEIEKAHPDVYNIFLQVFDDGRLTDGGGRTIDFKNTIIIMTSNIGARDIQNYGHGLGFGSGDDNPDETNKAIVDKALKKAFSPEFLNRIDDIITFNSLSRDNIHKIIDIELDGLYKRIAEHKYSLTLTDKAKDFLTDKGYDPKFGARPLKRAIQKYLEDELAELLLETEVKEGDEIVADVSDDGEKLNLQCIKKND